MEYQYLLIFLFIIITLGIFILFYNSYNKCENLIEPYNNYSYLFNKDYDKPFIDSSKIKNNKIFISIASYRDAQVIPTVKNIIENSDNPENLTICILEQNDKSDPSIASIEESILNKSKIILEKMDYTKAMGPSWARYLIQQKWDHEEYFMQIDSHTMFDKHWDTELKDMLIKLPKLSVLSQYPPEYNLKTGKFNKNSLRSGLYVEGFREIDRFTRIQSEYHKKSPPNKPFDAEAWGACFSFSNWEILRDAPYDPYLPYLFFGEELDITLRLFTRGWKFYSPNKSLVFTNFKRTHRHTLWGDHETKKRKDIELLSRCRLYYKFGMKKQLDDILNESFNVNSKEYFPLLRKNIERFNMGSIKNIKDYENFAGIDFDNQTVKGHNRKRIIKIARPKQIKMNGITPLELIQRWSFL